MSDERERLAAVVAAISDGRQVDWPAEDPEAIVRSLQIVARVADAHRQIQSRWGALEILEKVGEGAFGEVFRARDPRIDREVALKLLRPDTSASREFADSVIEEGRLLARVRHTNVATVYGAERHDGRIGIWLEFIHGPSLAELLREQGPFAAREASLIGIEVCRALGAVHRSGIVHGDVKAQNVLREEGGRIVLLDFGASRQVRGLVREDQVVSGTPLYMAPEVLDGAEPSVRSDLYGVGVLLFHLVSGGFPVEGASLAEIREKHRRGEARILEEVRADVPPPFVQVVERALSKDPEKRFPTAGQMERALAVALGIEPAPEPRPRRWLKSGLLTVGVLAVVVTAGLLVQRKLRDGPETTSEVSATTAPLGPRPRPVPSQVEGAVPLPPAAPAPYTVEAAFYRSSADGKTRLRDGDEVAPNDRIYLELSASTPLHVYVLDEDDHGVASLLFPIPGFEQQNPLPPEVRHRLPGRRAQDGKMVSWQVSSAGGREHLLVIASPARLDELDEELQSFQLPRGVDAPAALPLSASAVTRLRGFSRHRGITGLAEEPEAAQNSGRIFALAKRLGAGRDTAQDVWIRQLELVNPPPR